MNSEHTNALRAVPEQQYTFGVVKTAQRGDFQVLAERGRRALRVHLGTEATSGLKQLEQAIRQAGAEGVTSALAGRRRFQFNWE